MKRLGFVTSAEKGIGAAASSSRPNPAAIFTFDSGASMTLDDAVHHMLVLGGTGSGKTASVAMPLADHLIGAGLGGLICDIKGNMGDDIGRLAAACGRGADIVEYGSGPCANRVNLLRTMTTDGRRRFLEDLALENFNSNNQQWAMKGAHIAADCTALIDFLAPAIPGLDPSIGLIAEMLDNFGETASLWKTFRKSVFDNGNPAHRRFVSRVDNNKFHIFHYGDNKMVGSGMSRATWDEQVTWNLQGIRMGLRSFLDAPGVLENFCVQDAPGLDVARDVMDGRLILVRFGLATGPVGAKLTRLITSEVYRTVLGYGLEQRGKEFFVLMDEFQELADLSNGRFSDKNFIALARSYGGIFVGLTQSLASIRCEGNWNQDAVESFAANCNTVISFYCTDPATQEMARLHDPDVFLNDLEPNHAFVVRYDKNERRHVHGIETMNGEYREFKAKMEGTAAAASVGCQPGGESPLAQKSLYDIVDELEHPEPQAGPAVSAKEGQKMELRENASGGERVGRIRLERNYAKDLAARYPDMFSSDVDEISVPFGWRECFEKALRLFGATGLTCSIERVSLKHAHGGGSQLQIFEKDRGYRTKDSPVSLIEEFLESLSETCMICGERLSSLPIQGEDGNSSRNGTDDIEEEWKGSTHAAADNRRPVPICEECLEKFL